MRIFEDNKHFKLYQGSMLDLLEVIEPNSIDSIVTDPPYGLTTITQRFGKEGSAEAKYGNDGSFQRLSKGFMGKEWDGSGIEYNVQAWKKCYEVLKPGGYLLAFGGSRTFHRIAYAIEDAGFEIRDTIMWLYGSGFPKSMNIGLAIDKKNGIESEVIGIGKSGVSSRAYQSEKTTTAGNYDIKEAQNEWCGWGTALKPAYEPIIVARKPVEKSVIDNVMKYGVGGINIDECRVGNETISIHNAPKGTFAGGEYGRGSDTSSYRDSIGRFPANVILTYDETDEEEVCSGFPTSDTPNGSITKNYEMNNIVYGDYGTRNTWDAYQDTGTTARYFYCAKASKKDRDEGLSNFEDKLFYSTLNTKNGTGERLDGGKTPIRKNTHPTVKPTELMQYLIRLVSPKGATILDCFNGSGSTGKAVMYENIERNANYKYIGIDLDEEYLSISKARINYVLNMEFTPNLFDWSKDNE